jgi:protocatechuate 3,4-dioxygenase beta subunit
MIPDHSRAGRFALAATLLASAAAAQQADRYDQVDIPSTLSPKARLAPAGEAGEPLVVAGTVYAPDGQTPAAGVTVYAYQTDVTGVYRRGSEGPPRLRAWVKTDEQGRFELTTIRPGAYPGGRVPAHIHFRLFGPGVPRQWAEEMRFEDDPIVTDAMKARARESGRFAAVRPVTRGPDGVWRAEILIRAQATSNF